MHTIHPVTSSEHSSRHRLVPVTISRSRTIALVAMVALTLGIAAVPSRYGSAPGSLLSLVGMLGILGTFCAADDERRCRWLGGVHRERRDIALSSLCVAAFLITWLAVEVSTWI